jgi:hypothetical protein
MMGWVSRSWSWSWSKHNATRKLLPTEGNVFGHKALQLGTRSDYRGQRSFFLQRRFGPMQTRGVYLALYARAKGMMARVRSQMTQAPKNTKYIRQDH